jgi:hypothetical protein
MNQPQKQHSKTTTEPKPSSHRLTALLSSVGLHGSYLAGVLSARRRVTAMFQFVRGVIRSGITNNDYGTGPQVESSSVSLHRAREATVTALAPLSPQGSGALIVIMHLTAHSFSRFSKLLIVVGSSPSVLPHDHAAIAPMLHLYTEE